MKKILLRFVSLSFILTYLLCFANACTPAPIKKISTRIELYDDSGLDLTSTVFVKYTGKEYKPDYLVFYSNGYAGEGGVTIFYFDLDSGINYRPVFPGNYRLRYYFDAKNEEFEKSDTELHVVIYDAENEEIVY